jgi:parallel beta-helix repeat protein
VKKLIRSQVVKSSRTASLSEITAVLIRFVILLFSAAVGCIILDLRPSLAQTQPEPTQSPSSAKTMSQVQMLFVNPSAGDDKMAGNERAPLKTITQALHLAQANTVIMLSQGIYSSQTGETFPLILKAGVSLQGDVSSKGRNITIRGGDTYLSPTSARQNVTIVGANQSGIAGITITNPHPSGYGVWIESSSPTVTENTFTGSGHDGISVNGKSAPIIRNNYFYQNGANGITVYGTSQPEIRENVFERTGYGISINQNAAPMLVNNRIISNRTGVVVTASSRPILRNNLIEGNTQDGLVAIAQSLPDIGTTSAPGGNTFRNNGRYDVNGSASKQVISAFGNTISRNRTSSNIDISGTGMVNIAETADLPPRPFNNTPLALVPPTPTQSPVRTFNIPPTRTQRTSKVKKNTPRLSPRQTAAAFPKPGNEMSFNPQPGSNVGDMPPMPQSPGSNQVTPSAWQIQPNRSATGVNPRQLPNLEPAPVNPSTGTIGALQTQPATLPRFNYVQMTGVNPSPNQNSNRSTGNLDFVAPPPRLSDRIPQTAQPVYQADRPHVINNSGLVPVPSGNNNSGLVPVPGGNIPIGNHGRRNSASRANLGYSNSSSITPTYNPQTTAYNNTQYAPTGMGSRYRVFVDIQSENEAAVVRSLVPDAFITVVNGRQTMQVGAFSNRFNAEQMVQMLNSNRLRASIE